MEGGSDGRADPRVGSAVGSRSRSRSMGRDEKSENEGAVNTEETKFKQGNTAKRSASTFTR